MTSSRQAFCKRYGHDWTSWSAFIPAQLPVPDIMPMNDPVEPIKILAYRYRDCKDCGAKQRESFGDGTIEEIE